MNQREEMNVLLVLAICHVDKALEQFEVLTPHGRRKTKGRGNSENRHQLGTSLLPEHHQKINDLAAARGVWPGDALEACLFIYLDGDLVQAKANGRLDKLEGLPLASPFPLRPSCSFGGYPKDPARGLVYIDSSLFSGAFLTLENGRPVSQQARRAVHCCLKGPYFGVTTTLDLCELGDSLLRVKLKDDWLKAQLASFQKGPAEAQRDAVRERLQLIASSAFTIVPIEGADIAAAHETQAPMLLSSWVKLAALKRRWPVETMMILTLSGAFDGKPTSLQGVKYSDF